MALGLADDLLSSCCLYSSAPAMVAPAMNQAMWAHPAVKVNVATLAARGVRIVEPGTGHLACGDEGKGRMSEPAVIAEEVGRFFALKDLWKGVRVMVTAGPTREPLDPVRVLTNHSSGRMGYALARAARDRGAEVTLVSGPVALASPTGVSIVPVRTALEMHREVMRSLPGCDLIVMAAAVADYRPRTVSSSKIKKGSGGITVRLEKNPDILAEVLRRRGKGARVVGFAAETEDLEKNAVEKWRRKPCDMLVANRVGDPADGFHGERHEVVVYCRGSKSPLRPPEDTKERLADTLLDLMETRWKISDRR